MQHRCAPSQSLCNIGPISGLHEGGSCQALVMWSLISCCKSATGGDHPYMLQILDAVLVYSHGIHMFGTAT